MWIKSSIFNLMFINFLRIFTATSPPAKRTSGSCRCVFLDSVYSPIRVTINKDSNVSPCIQLKEITSNLTVYNI